MKRVLGFIFFALVCAALAVACGVDRSVVGLLPEAGSGTPIGASTDATAGLTPLECIATECPPYRADCPDAYGRTAHCGTRIGDDILNCGGCRNVCHVPPPAMNLATICLDGECAYRCTSGFGDCDGIAQDGCETLLQGGDRWNCGGCNVVCPEPSTCRRGVCTAPTEEEPGTGGPSCAETCGPQPEKPPPPNMFYQCQTPPKCWQLRCVKLSGTEWEDCNGDKGDGCEVLLSNDPKNCAACGRVCPDGAECLANGVCGCPPGLVACGGICIDVFHDSNNCGDCSFECNPRDGRPKPSRTQRTCDNGRCSSGCEPGWGDCDGDAENGCETDLTTSGVHCGVCGHACAVDVGQPCIDGVCLMRECDAGVTTR